MPLDSLVKGADGHDFGGSGYIAQDFMRNLPTRYKKKNKKTTN